MTSWIQQARRYLESPAGGSTDAVPDEAGDAARGYRLRVLAVFFVVSLYWWAFQSGTYRYAIPLELLGCLGIALAIQHLRWPMARLLVLALALVLVNADTRHPNWGRTRAASAGLGVTMPALPADAMVLAATGEPVAYLALGLPDSVPLISINNNLMQPAQCAALDRLAAQRIAAHAGAFYAIALPGADAAASVELLSRTYGLAAAGECMPIPNGLSPAVLCPLRRVRTVPACTPRN